MYAVGCRSSVIKLLRYATQHNVEIIYIKHKVKKTIKINSLNSHYDYVNTVNSKHNSEIS